MASGNFETEKPNQTLSGGRQHGEPQEYRPGENYDPTAGMTNTDAVTRNTDGSGTGASGGAGELGWVTPQNPSTGSPSTMTSTTSDYPGTAYQNDNISPGTFGSGSEPHHSPPVSEESEPKFRDNVTHFSTARSRSYLGANGIREGLTEAASGFLGKAQGVASDVAQRAQEIAGDVSERAQHLATETVDGVSTTVRKHPVETLLAGFGIGCLIGALIPRR